MSKENFSPDSIENWECVYETGTPYEAEMMKNSLQNMEIPCQILSKRDSPFNVNIGDLALIYLYVPVEFADQARDMVEEFKAPSSGNEDDDTDEGDEP
jgi:hypothetical protein